MNPLQAATAKAIVNIFETGRLLGNYAAVTVAAGDKGHLSYGRSQVSMGSGNLYLLIRDYCGAPDAQFPAALGPYLNRLRAADPTLDSDMALRRILTQAGADPVMRAVQDRFFDRSFWDPATAIAQRRNISTPLGASVVYDSLIHGGWETVSGLADRTAAGQPEKIWIPAYIDARRGWLARVPGSLLAVTVFRMDAFTKILATGNWNLALPLTVRGVQITEDALEDSATVRASAQDPDDRLLFLTEPYLCGDDVRQVQLALVEEKLIPDAAVDGIYGPLTELMVKTFQQAKGLGADGIVGPGTRAALMG